MCQRLPTYKGQFEKLLLMSIFYVSSIAYGQSKTQVQKIATQYNSLKIQALMAALEHDFDEKNHQLFQLTKTNNFKVSKTLANGNRIELQDISSDGLPIYYTTYNNVASSASRANTLYTNGLLDLGVNGEGMLVGLWDEGIARTSHSEFNSRVTITDESDYMSSHATRVMGTLIASGIEPKAQGIAYKSKAITNDWGRDRIEVLNAAAEGLLLSNHSYGLYTANVPDWYFGAYVKVSQNWDEIMYNAPYYLMISAAGNSQKTKHNESPISGTDINGYDLLLGFTTAKNSITVAAADVDVDNFGDLKTASVTNYSSFGPLDDGRIKPELASVGSFIYTTSYINDTSYEASSGTSMATPGVTGSLLLLQQYYERLNHNYMKAATLKGLALHTADDVNEPGPDYKMGWGIINTKKAAELITTNKHHSLIVEETLKAGGKYEIIVNANEKEALIASISWTDPASDYVNKGSLNDTSPALVNDLDIRITKNEEIHYPWKLNASQADSPAQKGDNLVDPFEKAEVENPRGTYTITVIHKGNLQEDEQNFSLILSGIAFTQCTPEVPTNFVVKEVTDSILTIGWKSIPDAIFEFSSKVENESNWTTIQTDENIHKLEHLELDTRYSFKVKTVCTENIVSEYSSEYTFVFQGAQTVQTELSSLETLEKPKFSLYPNPTSDFISVDGSVSDDAKYSIINATGTILKNGNAKDIRIGVGDLSSGMYILNIQDLNEYTSIKFYKY